MCTYRCTCMYIRTLHRKTYMCTYICVCVYACIYVNMSVCMHVFLPLSVHVYTSRVNLSRSSKPSRTSFSDLAGYRWSVIESPFWVARCGWLVSGTRNRYEQGASICRKTASLESDPKTDSPLVQEVALSPRSPLYSMSFSTAGQ